MGYINSKTVTTDQILLLHRIKRYFDSKNIPSKIYKNTIHAGKFYFDFNTGRWTAKPTGETLPLIALEVDKLLFIRGELIIPGDNPYRFDILKEYLEQVEEETSLSIISNTRVVHFSVGGIHIHIIVDYYDELIELLDFYINLMKKHFPNLF